MTHYMKTVMIALLIAFCTGCASDRAMRSDEEAMMMYRDCMGGMSQQWDSSDVSAGLRSEHVASPGAGADSHRDSRQHIECAQRASRDKE